MRYNWNKKIVLISLLFLQQHLAAQHHLFRKANMRLPSPECYRILQDNRGIIWISTEQGLCRFDGQRTRVYGAKEGIPEKAVYALRKDKSGRVWLLTRNGRILQIRNDRIVDPGFKQRLSEVVPDGYGYDFYFRNHKIYIPVGVSVTVCADKARKTVEKVSAKQLPYSLVEFDGNEPLPLNIYLPRKHLPPYRTIRYEDRQHPHKSRWIKIATESIIAPQIVCCRLKNRVFFNLASELIEIQGNGTVKRYRFPHRILSLLAGDRGGLWVGVLGYGVYHYPGGIVSNSPVKSLSGLSVAQIMEDREQHIWCTTLEKGVYICQQPQLLAYDNYQGLDRRVDILKADHDALLISSRANEIIRIDSRHIPFKIKLSGDTGERITAIHKDYEKWLVGFKERLTSGIPKNGKIVLRNHLEHSALQGIRITDYHTTIYVLSYHAVFRFHKGSVFKVIELLPEQAKDFLIVNPSAFFVATTEGIQSVKLHNGTYTIRKIVDPPVNISRLFGTRDGRIFVLTKGQGLYELSGENLYDRTQQMQIPTTVLNDAVEDKNRNLWFGTNEGLMKIPWQKGGYGTPELYSELHGLPSAVCDKLAIVSGKLAVSTAEGLVIFPLDCKLRSETKPRLLLEGSTIKGKPRQLHRAKLLYNENTLQLRFSVLSYHQPGEQRIRFCLKNGEESEKGISSCVLSFRNLHPGNYHLTVYGRNVYGIDSSIPIRMQFTILPPYWSTWWFIFICVASGILLLSVIIYWIRRRIIRKAEQSNRIQTQLAKSQLSALQAQMNPHFIFNSISSIQNYVMSNRPEQAYDYLTAFSKLIRKTLHNSRSQFISLKEELETIQLYMQLERRRYNNRFDFHLSVDENLDTSAILLPASLIQPLLENAVWHGIGSLEKHIQGVITLVITREKEGIRIVVTDNGTGIGLPGIGKQSLAMTILKERLTILGARSEQPFTSSVQLIRKPDLHITEASFTIPFLNSHESTTH